MFKREGLRQVVCVLRESQRLLEDLVDVDWGLLEGKLFGVLDDVLLDYLFEFLLPFRRRTSGGAVVNLVVVGEVSDFLHHFHNPSGKDQSESLETLRLQKLHSLVTQSAVV